MIKKVFIRVLLFFCFTNTILYGSQSDKSLLQKRIQETMQTVHEKIVTDNLEHIVQAHGPLNDLCNYLTGIPTTPNFKIIHTVFEHLKNQVYDLNQHQPVNLQSALQIQADYCKLLYACFERHNQDIKKRFFPFQKVINTTIVNLQTYINLHNNSFHQTFPGVIDYTLLQDSMVTFFKKIADPDIHLYILLESKNVTDSLQRLQNAIDTVSFNREEEQIDTNLAVNDFCNAYIQLMEVKNYLTSKDFLVTLPLVHHSFNNDLNKNLALIVENNDQFKTIFQYTQECGSKLLTNCVIKPCVTIKNIVNHRNKYYEIVKKETLLNYVMRPLHSCSLPNSIMSSDTRSFGIVDKIKNEIKKKIVVKPIEVGKNYLAASIHTMEDEKNSLQINLDKNFFNAEILEKIIASLFMKLPIHNQDGINLSWAHIIFFPHTIMFKDQHASKTYFTKNKLSKVLTKLTNKEFFANFIKKFKVTYRNEFYKKLALWKSILHETLALDLHVFVSKNEHIFIFNKEFYKALNDHSSPTKTNMLKRLGDIALKKIAIYEQIVVLEKAIKDLLSRNESSSLFNKVVHALDDFLYVRELLLADNQQQHNILLNQMAALKEKELKYYTLFSDIECLQKAIKEQ